MYKYNKTKMTYNFKIKPCGRYLGLSMNLSQGTSFFFFLLFNILGEKSWQTVELCPACSLDGPYQPVLTRCFAGLWSILNTGPSPITTAYYYWAFSLTTWIRTSSLEEHLYLLGAKRTVSNSASAWTWRNGSGLWRLSRPATPREGEGPASSQQRNLQHPGTFALQFTPSEGIILHALKDAPVVS
jgi:hypothetical protein